MKIAIVCVPYFSDDEHVNLAERTMSSLKSKHELDRIAIINRYRPDKSDPKWLGENFDYVELNDENIVARAWNKGMRLAFARGAKYAIVINLDLIFHPKCIDNLVALAEEHPSPILWSATEHEDLSTLYSAPLTNEKKLYAHYSCFMADQRLMQEIGGFDEQFKPAYYEDSDMRHRIKVAGFEQMSTSSARFYHNQSSTILAAVDKDLNLMVELDKSLRENPKRYLAKWGGPPFEEKFQQPYRTKD